MARFAPVYWVDKNPNGQPHSMQVRFEIGSADAPLGHAFVFFTTADDPSAVFSTYVFVPPIPFNFEQYVPPALSQLLPSGPMRLEMAAPMPPVAEAVDSVEWLRSLATLRNDDLVDAGTIYSRDFANLAAMTQEATAEYARLFQERMEHVDLAASSRPTGVDYGAMSEADRLGEMTRLVGRLRDDISSAETAQASDVRSELERIATSLPAKYRAWEVVEAASVPGSVGQQLASLQLTRCYKLLSEEYLDVADIERQIKELQAGTA